MNIKDIAKLCNVSPSTVSKILNNKDEDISEETRKKVLGVIREYQYVPYSKVIRKNGSKSSMLGLLASRGPEELGTLVYEVERAAAENGYTIVVCNTPEGASSREAEKSLRILESKGIDGLILLEQEEQLAEKVRIPAAAVCSSRKKTGNEKVADVYYEMQDVSCMAVHYLLDQGHRRIGCILRAEDEAAQRGYIRAYQEAGLSPNQLYIYRSSQQADIAGTAIPQCLENKVTAIVCADTVIACQVYGQLRSRGVVMPQEMSVISIRGGGLEKLLTPGLTCVEAAPEQIARGAVEALLEIIEGKKPAHDCRKRLEIQVTERESVLAPADNRRGGKIVVVGSMNMDCIISVPDIPKDGATVLSHNIITLPGGKGANQAAGVGKLDGSVYMIGRLGNDSDGKEIYNNLVNSGVKMDGVEFDTRLATGKAYINVPQNGESSIVIYRGANENLGKNQVNQYKYLLEGAKYCLLSLEIAESTAEYTMKECVRQGVSVIVKPSTAERIKDSMYRMVDYFIPNEKEAGLLAADAKSIEEMAEYFLKKGVRNVIITLGIKGCYLRSQEHALFFPSADFAAVDTTGAADAFIATLAVYLSEGHDIVSAIGYATYGAGISITRYGVQIAMTDRVGLEIYKDEIRGIFKLNR